MIQYSFFFLIQPILYICMLLINALTIMLPATNLKDLHQKNINFDCSGRHWNCWCINSNNKCLSHLITLSFLSRDRTISYSKRRIHITHKVWCWRADCVYFLIASSSFLLDYNINTIHWIDLLAYKNYLISSAFHSCYTPCKSYGWID